MKELNEEKISMLEKILDVKIYRPSQFNCLNKDGKIISDLQLMIDERTVAVILPRSVLFDRTNLQARKELVEGRKIDIIIYLPKDYLPNSSVESCLIVLKQGNVGYRSRKFFESILYGDFQSNDLINLRNIPFGLIAINEYKLNL